MATLAMLTVVSLLAACGGDEAGAPATGAVSPSTTGSASDSDSRGSATEPYRLRIDEIDRLIGQVEHDLAILPRLLRIDQAASAYRLERLLDALQQARAMAVAERFNQNAVTKYRVLRDRYRDGGFSPLAADVGWDAEDQRTFDREMDRLVRGFGEHDSDHLPWLETDDSEAEAP